MLASNGVDCFGTFDSAGSNLVGNGCNLIPSGGLPDLTGPAGLGPISTQSGSNGPMPGRSHASVLTASLTRDAADPVLCTTHPDLASDQLLVSRGTTCDIGAVEF